MWPVAAFAPKLESNSCDSMKPNVFFFFFFVFLGPHPWQMDIPRLGVESELQLLAYTTTTATQDPSHVCDLHQSSPQRWILSPRSEARDRTHDFMVPSRMCFRCATTPSPTYL